MYKPTSFPGQQSDEKIVTVLHRHWFIIVRQFVQVVLLAILPTAIVWLTATWANIDFTVGTLSYTLLVMGGSLYAMFLLLFLYNHWLDYALDVFIVSDKRVVDIEQGGLFNRTVAEQRLYRVQDVTYEIRGVIRTVLKYGDVYIQTAGEKQRFVFEDVPHPDRVAGLILRLLDAQHPAGRQDLSDPDTIMRQTPPEYHQHPPTPKT